MLPHHRASADATLIVERERERRRREDEGRRRDMERQYQAMLSQWERRER
jgi:hypothetical protein